MGTNYPPSVASLSVSVRWMYRELAQSPDGKLSKDELQSIMGCDRSTINRSANALERANVAEIVCSRHDVQVEAVALL